MWKTRYGEHEVVVRTGVGKPLSILDEIENPQEFYGDPLVDHMVSFGKTFESLIGTYSGKFATTTDIVILEHHYNEAVQIIKLIDSLAQKLIADKRLYDDLHMAQEYFELAKAGYSLMRKHQSEFGITDGVPVSLERGGLVATRLGLGLPKDSQIENEVRVVTKRVHPKNNPHDLAVTVKWRDVEKMKTSIDGQAIEVIDFVNPASGASTVAFLLAGETLGVQPRLVAHRSISATKQGIMFNQLALADRGIKSSYYSLGICSEMNELYYLSDPGRAVGDAGHILRHNLPKWY